MEERPPATRGTSRIQRSRSAGTRDRIMAAAEEVFAREGVASGSMAAILRAAGQRNEAAIAYHFGSREALARAIIETRRQETSAARREMLASFSDGGRMPTIREALETIVYPAATALETRRGRNYLRILADVFRGLSMADRQRPRTPDLRQSIRLIEARLVHLPEEIVTERLTFAISAVIEALAHRATDLETHADPFLDAETWARNMVLMLEAILTAPLPEGIDRSRTGTP